MSERSGWVRSFAAVLLPERVRTALAARCGELRDSTPDLAWVRPDNLHVTLRFLGEIEPAALDRAREAVTAAAAGITPFTITVEGLGGFPPGRPPRVVWAGITAGATGLVTLHATLDAALVARGFPREDRAFHGHVTLARARARRGAGGLAGVLGAGPEFGEVRVTTLHLMRSELDPRGARYSVLAAAPLGSQLGVG